MRLSRMSLKINLAGTDPRRLAVDLLVVGVPEGKERPREVRDVLAALGPAAAKAFKRAEFTGKKTQSVEIPGGGRVRAERVLAVGLGNAQDVSVADVRRLAARAARAASHQRAVSLGIVLPSVAGVERVAAEGAVLGAYRFERYKTGERVSKYPLERVELVARAPIAAAARAAVERGQRIAECVCVARDLINTAPNDLFPEALAQYAADVARRYKTRSLSCTVLDDKQIREKGMHLIAAVGQGSTHGPRFVHMKYRPPDVKAGTKLKRLVFVGKGLTFDTGGICLKPAAGMEEMKGDMGGAANVIALMAAVAETQPRAEIHGLIGTAENMPDGNSYRPGDVFKSYNGKTVEIINTDAEGRLVLADVLSYGVQLEPDLIVDNATLTGACVVALGPTVSGFFTNRDELAATVARASKAAGEAMWHMPLVEDLREMLKSDWADLKHMGDRWGGSITAALFLREFVGDTPWIHVDIAGPSMASKAYDVFAKGGTGHGVLTFLELIDAMVREGDEGGAGAAPPPRARR
jgi:leucyl aminopeptidase